MHTHPHSTAPRQQPGDATSAISRTAARRIERAFLAGIEVCELSVDMVEPGDLAAHEPAPPNDRAPLAGY